MTEIGNYCMDKGERCGFDVWRKDGNRLHSHWHFATEEKALEWIDEQNKKEKDK